MFKLELYNIYFFSKSTFLCLLKKKQKYLFLIQSPAKEFKVCDIVLLNSFPQLVSWTLVGHYYLSTHLKRSTSWCVPNYFIYQLSYLWYFSCFSIFPLSFFPKFSPLLSQLRTTILTTIFFYPTYNKFSSK